MDYTLFFTYLVACGAAAATGAMFQPGDWYRNLAKPRWTPPDWLFPLAWTTLYICMSVSAMRVAQLPGTGALVGADRVQHIVDPGVLWSAAVGGGVGDLGVSVVGSRGHDAGLLGARLGGGPAVCTLSAVGHCGGCVEPFGLVLESQGTKLKFFDEKF
jgi:hypothetical protein